MNEMIDKILVLVIGLIGGWGFTHLSSWMNDRRGESRRKKIKLEEAYVTWLNSHSIAIQGLQDVVVLARVEPTTIDRYKTLCDKMESLKATFQVLNSSLHAVMIYERTGPKRDVLEGQTLQYEQVIRMISVIISHYATHFRMHESMGSLNKQKAMLVKMHDFLSQPPFSDSEEGGLLAKELDEQIRGIKLICEDNLSHLEMCKAKMPKDMEKIGSTVNELDDRSILIRKIIVS